MNVIIRQEILEGALNKVRVQAHTGLWHYRLFCDFFWNPIKPRGEVYNT
jgi:hypothetical protein